MNEKEIYHLLKKYRENQCTPEDKEQIDRWYRQFDEDADRVPDIPKEKLEQLWCVISGKLNTGRRRYLRVYRYVAAAVAVMVVVASGLLLRTKEQPQPLLSENSKNNSMWPAQGMVTLELNDGQIVPLERDTTIFERGNLSIKNDFTRMLDYSSLPDTCREGNETLVPVYNTVRTPVGGGYRVILTDGTTVWMNSCSSLKYPVPFTGEFREVELKGEAFFEVTKNGKPFIVKTDRLQVNVLGTSFNVSDYEEDMTVSTTLITGCVTVTAQDSVKVYKIQPGTTFVYDVEQKRVELESGNEDLYVSWKEGRFRFENMRLEDIMLKVKRWYECEVEYADASLKDMRFSGAAEKNRPAEYLLDMIETITKVRFRVDGKKIQVMYK